MAVYKRGDRWHYRFQVGGKSFSGKMASNSSGLIQRKKLNESCKPQLQPDNKEAKRRETKMKIQDMYLSELMELAESRLALIPRAEPGDSSFNWKDELYEEAYYLISFIAGNCPSNEEAVKSGMKVDLAPYPDCAGWKERFQGEVSIQKGTLTWYGKANPLLPYHGSYAIDWRVTS